MILVSITFFGYIVVAVVSIVGYVIVGQEGNCGNILKICLCTITVTTYKGSCVFFSLDWATNSEHQLLIISVYTRYAFILLPNEDVSALFSKCVYFDLGW